MSEQPPPLKCVIIDLDFFIEEKEKEEPVIRIRGKTEDNQPLIVNILGFYPYFFIDDIPKTTDAIQSLLYTEKEFPSKIDKEDIKTENEQIFKYLALEGNIVEYNPWKYKKLTRTTKPNIYKSVKKVETTEPKPKEMSLKEMYDEFWELIDDDNEEFREFIRNDKRRTKKSLLLER